MLCIIGAGNVVSGRLLPALEWHGIDLSRIEVHGTLDDADRIDVNGASVPVTRHRVEELAQVAHDTDLIPWLATPPFAARRDLLSACAGKRLVCAKPLGMTRPDLEWLLSNEEVLAHAFVLSYYVQEKLAPVLWLTGQLTPPRSLVDLRMAFVEPGKVVRTVHATVTLSEPFVRTAGDPVSDWQKAGGIAEFAVHAPTLLANLGLHVSAARYQPEAVTFTGPRAAARVARPGPLVKRLIAQTTAGICLGDGVARSAVIGIGDSQRKASLDETCPAYGSVTAYALEWIAGGQYHGDAEHQVAALRTLCV